MRWIDAKEELPDEQGEYLAYAPCYHTADGGTLWDSGTLKVFCFAVQSKVLPAWLREKIPTGFYLNAIHYPEVTHWMELPPPPEKEE